MTDTQEPDTWLDPNGRAWTLHAVAFPEPDADDDEQWEPWYPDFPGQLHPQAYELRSGVEVDHRVVRPLEPWSPYDAISDQLIRDGWTPPPPTEEELAVCEHGLSAQLCAGPSHYPMEY